MEELKGRRLDLDRFGMARRKRAAHGFDALAKILHLGRIVRRAEEPDGAHDFVGNGELESGANPAQVVLAELFLLVRGHAALRNGAQTVALHGLREDDGGLACVLDGALISVVYLHGVVAAAAQSPDFVIAHVLDQLEQLGIFTEEFLAQVGAAIGAKTLVFAVDALVHAFEQQPGRIPGEQIVPIRAPDAFNDVPARAQECGLQFLNDAAVATHRPVQALQVAIDDEDEIVEFFARSKREGAE